MKVDNNFLTRFITNLGEFLGPGCEVVVHDYRKGFDHTVVEIVNGELSNRKVGDSPRGGLIVSFGKNVSTVDQPHIYFFTNRAGRHFKSCTTFIADEEERVIGAVCVNTDITELTLHANTIQRFIEQKKPEALPVAEENVFVNNVDDVLQHFLQQIEYLIGKPMSFMSKDEKIRALGYLDEKGVFKISKAAVLLCERFNVSKYTLYSYLDEARKIGYLGTMP